MIIFQYQGNSLCFDHGTYGAMSHPMLETETWAVILVTHVTKVEAIPRVARHDLESPWHLLHIQMQLFTGYSRFIVVYYINSIQIYTVWLLGYQEATGILPAVGLLHSLTTTCLGVLLMIELSKHKNHMVCLSLLQLWCVHYIYILYNHIQ